MTPDELEHARRESREMSDTRLAKLLADGPQGVPTEAWDVLVAERERRGRIPPRLRISDTTPSERTNSSGAASDEDRYPALRIIVLLTKVAAVLVFALSLVAAFLSVGAGTSSPLAVIAAVILGALAALGLWASAELTQVLIDIEANTRRRS
jgi:hypothetical protein